MEKYVNKISLKSKLINRLLILTNYKKRYLNENNVKKYIKKINYKRYSLPSRMKMYKEDFDYMDVFSSNGNLTDNIKDTIAIYIHGGSYIEQAIYLQIRFAKLFAKQNNATLIMPIYDTAPKGNYALFKKNMDKLYNKLLELNKRIIIFGDSAGAGFALSYCMELRNKNIKLPTDLVLYSPWLDVTFSNSETYEQSKLDNLCSIEGNKYCGKLWARNISCDDYRISPINGTFNDLPVITIIAGGYDICRPDCFKLKEILKNNHYPYHYLEYYRECHNFQIYLTKESKDCLKVVSNLLRTGERL